MKKQLVTGAVGACLLAAGPAMAEGGFTYELELEVGVDSVVHSDNPAAELTDIYAKGDLAVEFALGQRVTAFAGLTFESVIDPVADRTFEDIGLYVGELGLSVDLGVGSLSFGKISPAFGTAWDTAPGFYGTTYAEDYELAEMIGVMGSVEVGPGTLTASLFYADDTALSDSWGTKRGRNTTAAGGAGNTGKLNNVALQYDAEFGGTTLHIGARALSKGVGDTDDERGVSIGFSHAINDSVSVMGEVAKFTGFGGSSDDALFTTLGLSVGQGPITYNATIARRDIDSTGIDTMFGLGVDYEMKNGATLTGGVNFAKEGGVKSRSLGVAVVIPFGG